MFKRICIPCAAMLCLLLFAAVGAQDDEDQPALIEQRYDLTKLLDPGYSEDEVRSDVASIDIELHGLEPGADRPDHTWWRRGYDDRFRFEEAEQLRDMARELGALDDDGEVRVSPDGMSLIVNSTEKTHARIRAALNLLDVLANTKVRVELRSLDRLTKNLLLTKAQTGNAGGMLIGSTVIANGQRASFSTLTSQEITYKFESSGVGSLPVVAPLHWGEEWELAVLLLPDGRVRFQGYHAHAHLEKLRELDTLAGRIQLPTIDYDYTPFAGVIDNGGGVVIDTGRGAYLLTASHAATSLSDWQDDTWRLLNPGAWPPHDHFVGPWFLSRSQKGAGEDPRCFAPVPSGHWRLVIYPGSSLVGAVESFEDSAESYLRNDAEVDIEMFGPMAGLFYVPDKDLHDAEESRRARGNFDRYCNELQSRSAGVSLRLTLLSVPRGVELPGSIVEGVPASADITKLQSQAGVMPVLDRRVQVAYGQKCDVATVRMQNYLGHYGGYKQWDEPMAWETLVGTAVDGAQIRYGMNGREVVDVIASWRPSVEIQEKKPGGDIGDATIETVEGALVDLRINDTLNAGGALSTIQPLRDDTRVVLIVQREEEK